MMKRSQGFSSTHRLTLVVCAVVLCFAGVVVRLVDLHILDRERLLERVEKARVDIITINARRGDIKDANGKTLATSKSQVVLGVDPQVLREVDRENWPKLARLIGMPLPELERIFEAKTSSLGSSSSGLLTHSLGLQTASATSPKQEEAVETLSEPVVPGREIRWAKLCEGLDESVYERVMALGIKGVYGNRQYRRVYPYSGLAAHIIGYVNKENAALAGIERYANFYLKGQKGWVVSERDGSRREMAQFRTREVRPEDGYDVVLSIDAVIQSMVEEELRHLRDTFNPQKATIIVSDARTGFLLALGNYPSFNPNEYFKSEVSALKNVALTDIYEPGSTFKIIAASAALDSGLISPAREFDCSTETVAYKGKTIPLREDHRFEHPLSVREILSHSSNRGAAQMAFLVGEQRYSEYVRAFNFGVSTGFPTDSESRGIVHPWEKWTPKDFSRIAMGHTVSVTPLQAHCAMAVIASGGEWLRPQVIREIRDASGEAVFRYGRVAERRVIAPRTAREMARMLAWVTIKGEGTAPTAAIKGFEVAGKTGTTQKIKDGAYSSRHHVASFVGFFPASRPEIVISVFVDEASTGLGPRGVAYGSSVAAPSFKRVGEQIVQYLNIKPVEQERQGGLLAMLGKR